MKKKFFSSPLLSPNPLALILGYVYWIIYQFFLGTFLVWLLPELGVDVYTVKGNSMLQLSYMVINFIAVLLIFRRFLWKSLKDMKGKLRHVILSALLGFAIYNIMAQQVAFVYFLFDLDPQNLNQETVDLLLEETPWQMLLCTVFFAPIVEECLFRGLFFAPLYRKVPILAYIVSAVLFSAVHVVGGIGQLDVLTLILCFIQYLPAGIALGFVYQRTGNIIGPMLLHFFINFIASAATLGM